ncbi:MAG: hypothetical protein K2X26_11690 [Chitinophagaceae bacterium]|nr:hypothetical protein [Chitinophagaceae bacterium]
MDQETNSVRLEKLKDQFGDNTRKTRRNLVILCAITLVLSLGDLKLENLFGINLADQAS